MHLFNPLMLKSERARIRKVYLRVYLPLERFIKKRISELNGSKGVCLAICLRARLISFAITKSNFWRELIPDCARFDANKSCGGFERNLAREG